LVPHRQALIGSRCSVLLMTHVSWLPSGAGEFRRSGADRSVRANARPAWANVARDGRGGVQTPAARCARGKPRTVPPSASRPIGRTGRRGAARRRSWAEQGKHFQRRMRSGSRKLIEGRNPLSDTTDVTSDFPGTSDTSTAGRRRRAGGGLAGMLLGELQQMAASMGISGTARMRKGDLIAAIEKGQAEGRVPRARATSAATATEPAAATATERAPAEPARGEAPAPAEEAPAERRPRRASRPAGPPE